MAAIHGNVQAIPYNANFIAQQNCSGLDAGTIIRIIGAVILAVAAIFQILACCLGWCEEDNNYALANRDIRQLNRGNQQPVAQTLQERISRVAPVSEEATQAAQDLQINPITLSIAPAPVTDLLRELAKKNDVRNINIDDLLTCVDTYVPEGRRGSPERREHDEVRTYIGQYIQFIKEKRDYANDLPTHPNYDHAKWDPYYSELELLAKNLIFEFRNPEIPAHKKKTALVQIADAKQHCRPRILEETRRQFLSVTGRLQSMGDKILRWAQTLKEDIILEVFQGGQFHVVNQARQKVGEKWGLNRDPLNLSDPHINCGGVHDAQTFERALTNQYTPARLIETVRTRMVYDNDMQSAMDYLAIELQRQAPEEIDNIQDYFEAIGTGRETYNVVTARGVAKFCELAGLLRRR